MITAETYPYFKCFTHVRRQVREKIQYSLLHRENFVPYTIKEYNNVTAPNYPFLAVLLVKWWLTRG